MAGPSEARKRRPRRSAAPPLKREALIYCPRLGEDERTSSRRGPGPHGQAAGRGREVRRAEKPGRVSAREPPGKSRRNWVRRAAARPRASCGSRSSEEGAPRPLPQAATGEWRSARRGALLPSGDPRVHHGSMCAQVQALPPSENPCSVGGVLLLRETERSVCAQVHPVFKSLLPSDSLHTYVINQLSSHLSTETLDPIC